ncbi:hypothetical protein [Streptomyces griseocarneus]|uniref:hypothetical protein n=1 Tax=Streptomyces griseocarneus TaxID=51201 RepID=UPI00167D157B|nr:hypothetical protein [Streptomyces griseocarneus]MBZ6475794.1 hypothetical protein [Streptomyces griseocarneus]GHG50755.1 hypothetical protein GCM10018779_11120 [Streptomyces griseocarneus]
MADRDDTLIVPVNVDALVVNQSVRQQGGQGFRRWQPNFQLLRHNRTPEPGPFTNEQQWNATGTEGDGPYEKHDGVYVRWELPQALRQGAVRTTGGRSEFPLVPNRWLVVRRVKDRPEQTAGWVVESDFLDDGEGTSPFVHPVRAGVSDPSVTPYRSTIITTRIGRSQDIGPAGTAWSEPAGADRKELFLTAVGPGLMTFHVYQPYNENVFSLHDPLTGIDKAAVDYQVVGWYSDPAQEELRRRLGEDDTTLAKALAGLGWTVQDLPEGWTPGRTAYCGRTVGVAWDRRGKAPASSRPEKEDVQDKVAVGSSAKEALAALIGAGRTALPAGSGNGVGHTDAALLHAVAHGLTDTLDGPDGAVRTAQALHKGWFEQLPGGYVWRLADSSDQGNASGTPASVTWSGAAPEQERWLAELNKDQAAHDEAARELAALQKRLYALWWMHGLPLIPPQYTRERFRAEIDPSNAGGLAALVRTRQEELARLQAKVPHGANEQELARSVAEYLKAHPLPKGYELRREALPPFHQPTDPTVVLAGAKSHTAHTPLTGKGTIACRLPGQILGGVAPGGDLPAPFAALKAGGLPPVAAALLGEFAWLLDPANAGSVPPEVAPQPWEQPWKPLLFQWRVRHWTVPFQDETGPNWRFDGSRYRWERGTADAPVEVTGRRFLVPLPQYALSGELDKQAADRPEAAAAAFTAAADRIKDLDLLSQSLDGLTDAFAGRDAAPNLSPPGEIGRLVGDVFGHLPKAGPLPAPFDGWQPSGFTRIRAGQFALSRLSVVDEFGRTLDVLLPGDGSYLIPDVADSLGTNGRYAAQDGPHERFVQLPPRLLQPARLRFDFVDEHDDDHLVDLTENTTPVAAWIIPNYVDRSLLCYAPTGAPLGELRLKLSAPEGGGQVTTEVGWGPLPDSHVHTLEDLRADRPHLYAFARELATRGPAAFTDLLSTVDQALAGIDPGNPYGDEVLGALLGRPLALVRARLGFELDGPPVADPGWQYALDWKALTDWRDRIAGGTAPAEMDHLNYRWPIRLGNAGQKGDGLIGYFTEDDYTTFHSVAMPDTSEPTGYVDQIADANWPRLAADSTHRTHLTLLLDPQAAVHATTDVLPVTDLALPSRFTRTAMAAMRVALRLSPVLTTTRKVPTKPTGFVNSLALPHPTSPQGVWDWSELVVPDASAGAAGTSGAAGDGPPAPEWAHQPIVQIDQTARLDEDGPVVRTGFLRLSSGFNAS